MFTNSGMDWMPGVLMALAFAGAVAYTTSENAAVQRCAAGTFGLGVGAALLFWGSAELKRGRIRGKRVSVRRADSPVTFLLLLFGKRFVPGTLMIGAAIWFVFFRPA